MSSAKSTVENLVDVSIRGKLDHDFQLFHLDINRVVIFTEEHFDLMLQNTWAPLNDQVDISQGHVLDLRLS